MRVSTPVAGIPGTDATASQRGYHYQNILAALAWTKLGVDQELHVELAEDYAVATESADQVAQVKDTSGSLTLTSAVEFLNRALQILGKNPGREITFVYLTTADVGLERDVANRPEGMAGILYWREVQAGAAPAPLIEALKRIAPASGLLGEFLSQHDEAQVVEKLVGKVSWAYRLPESEVLKNELSERVARIAHEESGMEYVAGRRLFPAVLEEVTNSATKSEKRERVLTYIQLRTLIQKLSSVTLSKNEHIKLLAEAEFAKNSPTTQVNADIRNRLDNLRLTRYLPEARASDAAKALGDDVKDGGVCRIGDSDLRALALAWCARVLIEESPQVATDFLENAEEIAVIPETKLVRALLASKLNKVTALKLISEDKSTQAETVRFAIHRFGADADGLNWLEENRIEPEELDAGGQALVTFDYIRAGQWDRGLDWVQKIPPKSYEEFPVLLWAAANTLIAWATVDAARNAVLTGPPIINEVPLRDDGPAIVARRRAVDLLKRFHTIAETWGLLYTAQTALEFALWLMLEDQSTRSTATAEISRLWIESNRASKWVAIALRAGVDVDKSEVAAELGRRYQRYGSLSIDEARARLALVLSTSPKEWIEDWDSISESVSHYFQAAFLQHIHIQGLVQLGMLDDARAALVQATALPDLVKTRFKIELGEEDQGFLEKYRAAVEEDGSPGSLLNLVGALVKAGNDADATDFALKAFQQTSGHESAEEYLRLLARQKRWEEALCFLDRHAYLLEQSTLLQRIYVNALIRYGRWQEARSIALDLAMSENEFLEMELQIAVSSGKWEDIGALLERAWANEDLDADEAVRFARVATNLGNASLAKRLIKRAAVSAGGDPNFCWSAYMLAVSGQWEDDPAVREWVAVGVASANKEGSPVRTGSLSDLVEMAPQWQRKTASIVESIAAGEMFLAVAAQHLNRPLAGILVGNAIANESASDFRRTSPIPAFSGASKATKAEKPESIALDATAVLTLARLNLLDKVHELFKSIRMPYSTGGWLFYETSRVKFHQPGRISEARRLVHAVAKKDLREASTSEYSTALGREVGVDLAQLLHQCQKDRDEGGAAFVVRSSPLHRAGSLLEEKADLGEAESLFCSTLGVVNALHRFGAISDHETEEAIAYLRRVDSGWPSEPSIPPGATLYLDELTVTYFQHVGIIRQLASAGFNALIHPDVHAEAQELSALEDTNEEVGDVLDKVRRFFVQGQASGVIRVLPKPTRNALEGGDEVELSGSVLLTEMFERSADIQAVVFDDRSINRYPAFSYPDGGSLPIYSTLDILDWLLAAKLIDDKDWVRSRATLRRAGYLFVPVIDSELSAALEGSSVFDGEMYESVAARAIRENHLLAQASGMLVFPDEGPWLASFGLQIASAMSAVWARPDDSHAACSAKATWLVELSRYDGFADRMLGADQGDRWTNLDALTMLRFLMNLDINEDRRADYNRWLDDAFLIEMAQARPDVFASLCQMVTTRLYAIPGWIAKDDGSSRLHGDQVTIAIAQTGREFINHLPKTIKDVIFRNDELFERLGLDRSEIISVNVEGSPEFSVKELYSAAAFVHGHKGERTVLDASGTEWNLSLGGEGLVVCRTPGGEREFQVAHSPLVSPSANDRVSYAVSYAKRIGLPVRHLQHWLDMLSAAPIALSQISTFEQDVQDCPSGMRKEVDRLFEQGSASVAKIVPKTRDYYDRLIAPWNGQEVIREYAPSLSEFESPGSNVFSRLIWSAHSSCAPAGAVASLPLEEVDALVTSEIEQLDLWSITGLIECLTSRSEGAIAVSKTLEVVTKKFADVISNLDRLELTVSLVGLVDGTLNTLGIMNERPPYWRRLASISHASLLERSALSASLDQASFSKWASGLMPVFQVATIADQQREPRWGGYLLGANQLRQELLGRVLAAFEPRRAEFEGTALHDLVFCDNEGSIASQVAVVFSALPGPLEGTEKGAPELSGSWIDLFLAILADDNQSLSRRVAAAAQMVPLGRLPSDAVDRLADATSELSTVDIAKSELTSLLMPLSLAAAAARSEKLASALKQVVLTHPSVETALRVHVGASACAAEPDRAKWCVAVGNLASRCTASASGPTDAEYLLFVLKTLCDVQPRLKPAVAPSVSRLQGVAKRRG